MWTRSGERSAHCSRQGLTSGLPTLGKLAMMRSRLTGGPRGGREALILPESSGDPSGGKGLGSCADAWGLTRKFTPNAPGALKAGPGLLLSLARRLAVSPLSVCRQEGGGEFRRPGPPSCCGMWVSNREWPLSERVTGCEWGTHIAGLAGRFLGFSPQACHPTRDRAPGAYSARPRLPLPASPLGWP